MAPYPMFPTRHDLLAIALVELATTRGVHDMSVRSLAAQVRAAPGSLTYHYGDKESMLAACVPAVGEWLRAEMRDRLMIGGPAALLPNPGDDDQEFRLHLKVWSQLTSYGLDAPEVAAAVARVDEQIRGLFTDSATDRNRTQVLATWATLRTLQDVLLRANPSVSRTTAAAALLAIDPPGEESG